MHGGVHRASISDKPGTPDPLNQAKPAQLSGFRWAVLGSNYGSGDAEHGLSVRGRIPPGPTSAVPSSESRSRKPQRGSAPLAAEPGFGSSKGVAPSRSLGCRGQDPASLAAPALRRLQPGSCPSVGPSEGGLAKGSQPVPGGASSGSDPQLERMEIRSQMAQPCGSAGRSQRGVSGRRASSEGSRFEVRGRVALAEAARDGVDARRRRRPSKRLGGS